MNVDFLLSFGCPLRRPVSNHLICHVTHLWHHVPGCVSPKVACSVSAWTRTSHVKKNCKPFDSNQSKGLRDTRTRPRANKRCKLPLGHVAHDHFSLCLQAAHGKTQYGVHVKMAKNQGVGTKADSRSTTSSDPKYDVLHVCLNAFTFTPHSS